MNKNYALINCNVIDVESGEIKNNMTILINQNGLIEEVGESLLPRDYEIIDIKNKYVMPGLINAHVHLFSKGIALNNAKNESAQKIIFNFLDTKIGKLFLKKMMKDNIKNQLNSGVTTIRCVGDLKFKDIEIRDEIKNNKYLGPNMVVSGQMISVTGGHGAPYIAMISDSLEEGIECVNKNIKAGADLIKICVTGGVTDSKVVGDAGKLKMSQEQVTAICKEAHKNGLMVAAHVQSTDGVRVALSGGVDTIEHGSKMDDEIIELYKNNPNSLRGYSVVVPTLHPTIPMNELDEKITGISSVVKQNSIIICNGMIDSLKQALENDIKVGVGTDAAMPFTPHYSTWRELDYLNRYVGLTTKQAIYLATKSNAEMLGIDNITGTIEKGKLADLLIIDENPLEDLKTLSKPNMVISRGNIIKRPKTKRLKKIDKILDMT